MELALRCAALCVLGSLLTLLLKKNTPELSLLLSLGVGLCAALLCSGLLGEIASVLEELSLEGTLSPVLVYPVLKCLGAALVTELAGALCRDAGESALASFAEICGTLCAVYVTLPLLRALLAVVASLV
ncbi:MAG: stage III sporulation AC/AD family protein [Oscillospiraceae bacterium]|nr:stage III sporulation AC/AD family protein [Oscillospiraceae bacterium]